MPYIVTYTKIYHIEVIKTTKLKRGRMISNSAFTFLCSVGISCIATCGYRILLGPQSRWRCWLQAGNLGEHIQTNWPYLLSANCCSSSNVKNRYNWYICLHIYPSGVKHDIQPICNAVPGGGVLKWRWLGLKPVYSAWHISAKSWHTSQCNSQRIAKLPDANTYMYKYIYIMTKLKIYIVQYTVIWSRFTLCVIT